MKKCPKCLLEKSTDLFGRNKNRIDGYKPYCKECSNKLTTLCQQKKRLEDPAWYEAKLLFGRLYKLKRNSDPEYKKSVNNQIKQLNKSRLKTDPLYRVSCTLRTRTNQALAAKQWPKKSNFAQYLGCSPSELKIHLENLFKPGMTWENHSIYGWHIDHVKPLSLANNEEELYKLCHYTNLQPMWAKDNLSKGDNYE
jgi:hypothetical protein